MINIIFKNNITVEILAIKLLNTTLILVFLTIKSLLKMIVCFDNFSALFGVP
jgi:hypothetical protein